MDVAEFLPGSASLVIYRGDSLDQLIEFSDGNGSPLALPTSGWDAQIRQSPRASAILASFVVDAADAGTGSLTISLTSAQTGALPRGPLAWDLQLTIVDQVRTYLRGTLQVVEDVTRV